MKSDNLKESRNIEDRRGQSYSHSSGNSNLGGGILQILLSPGSFKSKIVLILLLVLLGGGGASLVFGCQFLVEAHIQINLFVGWTVEGTSRCLPNPTACLCPSGIED